MRQHASAMVTTCDVAVVGAGVHGATAAYHLADMGLSTVLVERDTPASGPTGLSSAVCRAFYTNPFLAQVAHQSIEMLGNLAGILPEGYSGFQRTGCLYLHPREDADDVTRVAAELTSLGISIGILAPQDVADDHPLLDLAGVGVAVWEPDGGYADPAGTTTSFAHAARELGAERRFGVSATAITQGRRGRRLLLSSGETLHCGRVLVAAGPWTRDLLAPLGVDLPTTVERHVVTALRWTGAARIPHVLADLPLQYYAKPDGDELLCVGHLSPGEQVGPDDALGGVRAEEAADLGIRILQRAPRLGDLNVHGSWASVYDISPDWQPLIGEVDEGVVVHCGSSGHGFKLAPVLGRHVALLAAGAPVDDRLEQFHPRRFATGCALSAGFGPARILGRHDDRACRPAVSAGAQPPDVRLTILAGERFRIEDGPAKGLEGRFGRDASGRVSLLDFRGRIARRQNR